MSQGEAYSPSLLLFVIIVVIIRFELKLLEILDTTDFSVSLHCKKLKIKIQAIKSIQAKVIIIVPITLILINGNNPIAPHDNKWYS